MKSFQIQPQLEAEPLDEATHAALDEAELSFERGESVTLEQSRINARDRYKAWLRTKNETAIPV